MSIDIKQQLTDCLSQDAKSIIIPAVLFGNTGPFFDAINQFIQNQKLQLNGPNGSQITITGSSSSATVTGVGQSAPFGATTVTVTVTLNGGSVEIDISAEIQPGWSISTAWPGTGYPFSSLTITDGTLSLTANVGDKSLAVMVTVSASTYSGQNLSNGAAAGLLKVTWSNGELGFAAGFIVTNNGWNPLSALGIDKFTTITVTEIGLFLTTIALDADDLAVFSSLAGPGKVAFLPSSIDPGLTALAGLQLVQDVSILDELFTGHPTLNLTGHVASAGDEVSLSADLENVTIGTVTFSEVKLEWDSSAKSKKIVLSVISDISAPEVNLKNTGLCGTGTLIYSPPQSATFAIEIGKCGGGGQGWVDPFFIQNLTIDDFGIEVVLQESAPEVALNLGGTITIGTGPHAVDITAMSGLTFDGDIPAPSGVVLALGPSEKGKTVTLADIVTDVASVFGAHFDVSATLLNDIAIAELQLAVVQVPFTFNGVTYSPFISLVGDIYITVGSDKYQFDMMLTINTQADPPYMQACGTFNKNGGAVTIDVGSVNLVTMSNVSGTGGPAACIDTLALTSASNFCGTTCTAVAPGGTGYFLVANAKISVLSLVSSSIYAKVAKDSFDFLMEFNWLDGVLTTELACTFAPSDSEFAAAIEFGANLPDIKLDWGFIGTFTIPLPKLNVCAAVGTFVPGDPVFNQGICSGWTPTSAPYFYFIGDFSWGSLDWSVTISIDASDFQQIATAFSDFGKFLVTWIENNVGAFLEAIVSDLVNLLKLLWNLAWDLWDAVKAVFDFFANLTWEEVFEAAEAIWADAVDGGCAQSQAEAAYSGQLASVKPMLMPALGLLAESDAGQDVLYHYYLHQDEINELLRSDRESGRQAALVLRHHLAQERAHPTGRHVPAAIRALSQVVPYASDDLRSSLDAVVGQLTSYQHLDHETLRVVLTR
jgi:hypothetical protein